MWGFFGGCPPWQNRGPDLRGMGLGFRVLEGSFKGISRDPRLPLKVLEGLGFRVSFGAWELDWKQWGWPCHANQR